MSWTKTVKISTARPKLVKDTVCYCAKRSFHPVVMKNLCPFVRPSVRSFVRIIIDFCEEDMKGDETLLDTGSLNYGF